MTLLCAIVPLLSTTASANSNGEIGLFFDPGGEKCVDEIPCSGSGRVYVYAILKGASVGGLTGVEFGVRMGQNDRADEGWMFTENFNPDADIVIGSGAFHPADSHIPSIYRGRGVNIAFSECQSGESGRVLLETVDAYNVDCLSDPLRLLVVGHDSSPNNYFLCPLFTLCDAPVFTKVCLGENVRACGSATCSTSGEAIINPSPGQEAACERTPVAQRTWSSMKALYR
jgi:hypothetical protein